MKTQYLSVDAANCTTHTVQLHYTYCTAALHIPYSCTTHTVQLHYTYCTAALIPA